MPSLVVRNLDESIINALKQRAVEHQRSTEAEHRAILAEVLLKPPRKSFAEALADIPNQGVDADFLRVSDDTHDADVFG
ncbi:MAG: DNA-binding protein [Methylomicrobium sp.]|nr:DNA-binding protein [Methylomicrobium sp.]